MDGEEEVVEFTYDYMGRRVRKTSSVYNGGWQEQSDQLFVYDGWNVVEVLDANASNAILSKYTWGLDMSGQAGTPGTSGIHGAGGISGLLASVQTGTTGSPVHWYFYDANGNVGQILDATNLNAITSAARYEYDPYGNTLSATGAYAAANPFRFSTKWFDTETGLSYYGYRYYNARLGRWMSRDPIGERGGLGLYAIGFNDLLDHVDRLGQQASRSSSQPTSQSCHCCCCPESLDLRNIRNLFEGPYLYGHHFEVEAKVKYVAHTTNKDCRFVWMERSNRPAFEGKEPEQWYDYHADYPDHKQFGPWRNRSKPCPGEETVTIVDEPMADRRKAARYTRFVIRIESADDCPCWPKSITVYAGQFLDSDHNTGKITMQKFRPGLYPYEMPPGELE